ncbi:hypothetical protein J1N35_033519 [Gossypium stocksii]|uniref:RNase H type-1 domain-containing protein n=1 Tax=Gossypium stocksii TaxID=47602 RepID=A0A9D3UR48_9ROSI|nr:hypothetical protein J1N35_033519 [Gossypium stocksii]
MKEKKSTMNHMYSAFKKKKGTTEGKNSVRPIRNIGWRYPPEAFVKINFDGAYNERQNQAASDILVRDEEGKVLLSYSKIHYEISAAFAAEAIACSEAIQIEVERKWQHIIIEGDSLAIIKRCNTKSQDRSMVGAYIYDIKQKIVGSNSIRFEHTLRSANGLAHLLASETLRRKEEVYLEKAVPEYAEERQRMKGMKKKVGGEESFKI